VDLFELAEGAAKTLGAIAERNQVQLYVFVDPQLPSPIRGDPVRLRQVLFNLMGNAVKFSSGLSDRTGKVELRIESGGPGRLRMTVRDNGIGMSPASLSRLFQSFSQADASTTRRFGGTGLGLAISKRLLQMMDGVIGVQTSPGAGASFVVDLPLRSFEGAEKGNLPRLDGLRVRALPSRRYCSEDIARLLEAVGASLIQDSYETSEADVVIEPCAEAEPAPLLIESSSLQSHVRVYTPLGKERVPARGSTITLSGNPLSPRALLEALSVASGRTQAGRESGAEHRAAVPERPTPPAIAEARAAGTLVLVA
jgi:anti-sigma regulatory factor (Ser/Thr protein kinase)